MKKLILVLIFSLCSFSVFAAGISYNQVKETVTEYTPGKPTPCAPHSDTPFQDVERADIDLVFKLGVVDAPAGGGLEFYFIENWDLSANLNLGPTWYFYTTLSQRTYNIPQSSDAIYASEFKMRSVTGGGGIYIFPTFKVYAGGGKIISAEDKDGNEVDSLGAVKEVGAAYDYAWSRNKVVVGVKWTSVDIEKEDVTAAENDGNPSYVSAYIGMSIPFMR